MASVQDIYNEIDRIENAKSGIAEAIEEKGVEVPAGTMIQDFPAKVRQIQQGCPDAVLFTPQDLTPEQQAQARQNIGAGTYTKPNTGIPETDFAQGVQTSLEKANTAVQPDALTPITDLIPEQATPQNQLADKNFVNSSVATNTANYISDNGQPFQSVADLEAYTGTLTNNDYAFVVGTDSAGNTTYTRYKYNATTQTWAAEYVLNNSSFTAEQWAAISSGITALLVQKLSELPTEIVTYVAQTLTDAQKQQARTNIGATAPEIFWAVYGVTTFSDIEAQLNAGKMVFCLNGARIHAYAYRDASAIWFYSISGRNLNTLRVTPGGANWAIQTNNIGIQLISGLSQSIPADRESATKYPSVKAVFDSLGKWGIVSQTQTWTGSNTTGYDYTMSDPVWGLIPQANIDLYTAAGAVFNETTGYFELNGLADISYNEMSNIYSKTIGLQPGVARSGVLAIQANTFFARTSVPMYNGLSIALSNFAYNNNYLESVNFPSGAQFAGANLTQAFFNNLRLKQIIGALIHSSGAIPDTAFKNCFSLESLTLRAIKSNVNFQESSRLTLESVVYMVNNAANTTAITITLHATAYARCQADTTEYTYNGQTYTGIIAYAAAKNITIASA